MAEEDGRSARWNTHRSDRRAELIEAAVAAIDEHGPDVSVAMIAKEAGVSKPVIYRYFADKSELHAAVAHWAADQVLTRIRPAMLGSGPIRGRLAAAVESYLSLISEHPQVFRLLIQYRSGSDSPLAAGTAAISAGFSRLIGDTMRSLGIDAGGAEPWGAGLVGLGIYAGEWWLDRDTMSRTAISGYLTDFIWHAFAGMAAERGVRLDELGGMTRIPSEGAR
ncbi:TetR/AcrR family transcriptional regulator [Nocardioides sp. Bht2]|uniref:TetR/AcrR family transcriptional regulator n=1 Tax=Nocardioides sp. Bht2 TaxID=3392297 RepID=UPI0039B3C375